MKACLTYAFALLLVCSGAALAQTPDGTPPSQETVCDSQIGAAYGLCTAFCEAMDCDSDDPQASQNACDKVGAKFLTITGQAPPCVLPACPCVGGLPGFIEALNSPSGLTVCKANTPTSAGDFYAILTTGDGRQPGAQITSGGSATACGFFDTGEYLHQMTASEAEACRALVLDKAAAAGLTCTRF